MKYLIILCLLWPVVASGQNNESALAGLRDTLLPPRAQIYLRSEGSFTKEAILKAHMTALYYTEHGLSCGVRWKIHSFHFSVIRSGDTLVNGFNESGRWSAANLKKLQILESSDSLHYYQITIIDFRGRYVELKPMYIGVQLSSF